MNKIVTTERTAASSVPMSNTGLGAAMQPESLGDIVRFAELMCQSQAGIPSYLHGNAADCMAITMQALQWEFNPFSVAQKSYKVKDVLAFEAQLIAAVVNTRSGIKGRLKYAYTGEGQNLVCTVTGVIDDETLEYESPTLGSITTKNSPLWKTDPRQQLGYYSSRAWARRHVPEVLLGVYDRDEVEQFQGPDRARDVTPQTALAKQIAARQTEPEQHAQEPQEGFNADFVREQTDAIQSEPQDNTDPAINDESPVAVALELIASLKALQNTKQVDNTWQLQFEKRVAAMDSDDRRDLTGIAQNFSAFVSGKIKQLALDNFCEDVLAEIAERNEEMMREPA